MVKVLFVCYGNSCRSQMAEALANRLGAGKVQAFSAGTHPLGSISVNTHAVMLENAIALTGHRSKGLDDVPVAEMDVVVEMGYGVKCELPQDFKGRLIKWQIPDPFSLGRDYFRDVRDLIEREVGKLLRELEVRKTRSENAHSTGEGGQSAREP